MRKPRASIYYWLTTTFGGQLVANSKQTREFMHEVESWSDSEFRRATIDGDFGSLEVSTREELIAELWKYAVGPLIEA